MKEKMQHAFCFSGPNATLALLWLLTCIWNTIFQGFVSVLNYIYHLTKTGQPSQHCHPWHECTCTMMKKSADHEASSLNPIHWWALSTGNEWKKLEPDHSQWNKTYFKLWYFKPNNRFFSILYYSSVELLTKSLDFNSHTGPNKVRFVWKQSNTNNRTDLNKAHIG